MAIWIQNGHSNVARWSGRAYGLKASRTPDSYRSSRTRTEAHRSSSLKIHSGYRHGSTTRCRTDAGVNVADHNWFLIRETIRQSEQLAIRIRDGHINLAQRACRCHGLKASRTN